MTTSRSNGAPVDAKDELPDAAVATVGGVVPVDARTAGTGGAPATVVEPVLPADGVCGGVVAAGVVCCAHDASALPLSAASMPQKVTGMVAPVPGVVDVPIGAAVDPLPTHDALASPFNEAATAHTVSGAVIGASPVAVVSVCAGSQELFAVPATATTTLQALTGITPSTGALWVPSLVGRSLLSGKAASGMHMPLAEPSTATTAPQAVTGADTSAT